MERLTEPTNDSFKYDLKDHTHKVGEFSTYAAFFNYSMAVKRLGEYEDTGLEPEQAAVLKASLDAAIAGQETLQKHFAKYAEAEQEGRLVVLPCKVGDTVYFVFEGKVRDVRVQGIPFGRNNELILNFGGYPVQYAWGSEIGKTVFLTREEAERALAPKTIPVRDLYDEEGGDVLGETIG